MSAKYIITALVGSAAIAYVCDQLIADKKIFGGNFFVVIGMVYWLIKKHSCKY